MLDAEERGLRDEYERGRKELADIAMRIVIEGRAYVRLSRPGLLSLSLGLDQCELFVAGVALLRCVCSNRMRFAFWVSAT